MWLTKASLRNPIAVTLLSLLVVVCGAAAFQAMGRSILPPVSLPIVTVTAPYAGAGTEEMERLVIRPIEDELEGVPQLERVSSYAQSGLASIVVRFRFGGSLETDRSNVQQAVESARANMPLDLVPPVVVTDDPTQIPVLTESLTSAVLSPRELSEIVERTIAPAVRAAPAIGSVVVSGEQTREFTVVPNLGALDALGLTVLDLDRSLAGANDVLPGGVLRSSTTEATVGVRSASDDAEDLRRLPVAMQTANVEVGDVARVVDGRADETIVSRVDGAPGIIVFVSRAENVDALKAIAGSRRLFTQLARRYPLIRFETLRTDEPYTNAAIGGVLQGLGEGVALTVVVMVLFLHEWRNAVISAISIPASLCAAFVAMWIAGFTINVLSLMGLSLTIGILVDDSIVIIEAIARNAARGLKDDDAALAGRNELGGAAFAITLVDVAVFAPIAFMGGLIGDFMREFGLTVVFATAFSLVVAYTLTPLLAARWALPRSAVPFAGWQTLPWMLRGRAVRAATKAWHRSLARFSQIEESVAESYAMRWLPAAAKRRLLVLCGALAISIVALIPAIDGGIATEFSPPVDRGEAVVDLRYPSGTPLDRSDRETGALTAKLLEDPTIAHVAAVSGRGFNGSSDVVASNLAQLVVVLADPQASGDVTVARVKSLAYAVPDARITGSGRGMGGSAPISYTIAGEPGAADEAAGRLARTLEHDRNATDVRISNAGVSPRVEIDVDSRKAMMLGVAADDAAQTARIATGGAIAAKVRLRGGLANVVLRSDADEHGDLGDALRVEVRDRGGRLVPLADLVDVRRSLAPTVIEREDGRRVVTVTANPKAGVPIGAVTAPLARALRKPGFLPGGASVAPRGDVEQLLETMRKMLAALGLALIAVYSILAVLYRSYTLPFVIMATVPLAAAGALGALFVTREPLNLYSMLGIVMLVGLVAKNGILLVEYAQRAVRSGKTAATAMQDAARRRFRPIVMTTFAMIAGMLPLALGHAAGAEYRQALGTVVIGGLCSSLLLTLFVVPLVYTPFRTTAENR